METGESAQSLEALADEFVGYLRCKRGRPRSESHIKTTNQRVRRMLLGARSLEDVTPAWIERRMLALLAQVVVIRGVARQRSRQTIDHHRRELGAFFRWLVRRGVTKENPVARVDAFEWDDRRDVSRPFTPAEGFQFFERVSGRRVHVYLFWATSALRPAETKRAQLGHAVLDPVDGRAPYLSVQGAGAKNHRAAKQPLHPDVASFLRERASRLPATAPLFPRVPSAGTFKRDLEATGLGDRRETSEGRLTRTSLRKFLATELDRSGATEGLVQKLMRHSSPDITREHYTHYDLAEKSRAIAALSFLPERRRPA